MQIKMNKSRQFAYGNWVGLWTLIQKEVQRFLNVSVQAIVAPVMTTLLFYTVFALAFGGIDRSIGDVSFLEFLAPGLIMMSIVQNAFANSSSSWIIAKVQGTLSDVLMPPLSPLELYTGNVIGAVARGLLVGLGSLLVMRLFMPIPIDNLWWALGFAVLGSVMVGTIGLIAGIWAEKFDEIAVVTNFVVTPLAFLSGTFYAMSSLPEFWRFLAGFNPFYYMIDGFRQAFIGVGDTSPAFGALLLFGINILLGGVVLIMLRTGYKIKA